LDPLDPYFLFADFVDFFYTFFVAFVSATIDGRNLMFGHKLHISAPYRGKRFWTCHIPTSCLSSWLVFIHIEEKRIFRNGQPVRDEDHIIFVAMTSTEEQRSLV
jgi:hypothetical protein